MPLLKRFTVHDSAIITGEHHDRVLFNPTLLKGFHDLSDTPVHLMDKIAIGSESAFTTELLRRRNGDMGCN